MLLGNWIRRVVSENFTSSDVRMNPSRSMKRKGCRSVVTKFPEQLELRAMLTEDFGDAPASFPVTLAEDGARHTVGPLFLGVSVDIDADGIESTGATADGADDDGVVLDGGFVPGMSKTIQVTSSQAGGLLHGWIDWNADGDWADLGEQVFANQSLSAGVNTLTVLTDSS